MELKVGDAATHRRMLFATSYLPSDIPHYWDIVAKFANQARATRSMVTPDLAKLTMENTKILNSDAFVSDEELTIELINLDYGLTKETLGIPLLPSEIKCRACGGKLLLRNDRPSRITLYTETLGAVPATHFHKYCQNYRKGCKYVQYYGYHRSGNGTTIQYNENWISLPYFLSSQETGFEMTMLQKYDVELLIGKMSYKQKTDIYNVAKGYDTTKKVCSTVETENKLHRTPTVHGYVCIMYM